MAAAKKSVSGREAMVEVLRKEGAPMKTKALCAEALKLATGMKGKTPEATLAAILATDNKKGGVFVRTEPGTYDLRERVTVAPTPGRPPRPSGRVASPKR